MVLILKIDLSDFLFTDLRIIAPLSASKNLTIFARSAFVNSCLGIFSFNISHSSIVVVTFSLKEASSAITTPVWFILFPFLLIIDGFHMVVLFLPVLLEWYKAWSALVSSSEADFPCSGNAPIPRLIVMVFSNSVKINFSIFFLKCSAILKAFCESASGKITVNSSPPYLPNICPWFKESKIVCDTLLRTISPTRCP